MGDLVYRQPGPVTLQDLLAQAQNDQAGSVPPPPQPSQSSQIDAGGLSPQEHQKLLDILFAPEDPGPAPKVDKPKLLGQLLTGFGDAVTTYASILGNSPSTRTDAFSDYMNKFERQKADLQKYQEKVAAEKSRQRREGANYILGEADRKQERTDRLQAKAEDLAWRKTQVEQANADRDAARQQAKAINDADNATRLQIEKMGNDARARSDSLQVQLHSLRKTGEADKDQHAEYAKARQFVVGKKAEYMQMLADGKATPEQIIAQWQDTLDASDLSGKYREAADAFFQDKIGTLLMQYTPQQGPAPQPFGATGPIPQGQIDTNRQVARQGPKY